MTKMQQQEFRKTDTSEKFVASSIFGLIQGGVMSSFTKSHIGTRDYTRGLKDPKLFATMATLSTMEYFVKYDDESRLVKRQSPLFSQRMKPQCESAVSGGILYTIAGLIAHRDYLQNQRIIKTQFLNGGMVSAWILILGIGLTELRYNFKN